MSRDNSADSNVILPGAWLGMLGGGQLGRMFTHAAQRMGYHVAVFESRPDCPAAQSADRFFSSNEDSDSNLRALANLCDAVSLEFENIDAASVDIVAESTAARPGAHFLRICQNRILEKQSLADAGFPTTPFAAVTSADEVIKASETLDWPLVLKTATSGYDGKGQAIVRSEDELEAAWAALQSDNVIAEKWIPFDREVSLITARSGKGEMVSYPLFENEHSNHILDVTRCPASPELLELESSAIEIGRGIADAFDVVGLFCVEFFVTQDGQLLINEIAPRPHNSGHITMEAFDISQFDLQVRAICNLPLPQPTLRRPGAMANLLGDIWADGEPRWTEALQTADAHLHLYGKPSPRPGRKMGHLNVLSDSADQAVAHAKKIRSNLAPT
ncbi:MAG: 5-(carboxyamino)imidazole ribonucleotide synthase [Aureliella sp.]